MVSRENAEQRKSQRRDEQEEDVATTGSVEANEELAEDVDAILDEIDGVLEENAEDFVKSFVQKGGQ
ncbi:ubiquitin-like protein Pup [Candidatus Nanopelagicales bacterium]|jgi:ubiquitin-like protein Pup|nr:ubiquitin-like protein Pup [Candidatus Nanopelagicales bacterium]